MADKLLFWLAVVHSSSTARFPGTFRMHVSNRQFQLLLLVSAFAGMLAITNLRYCGSFDLPGKPAKPIVVAKNAREVSERISRSTSAYQGYIDRDAKAFGIPKPRLAQMAAVFPYHVDKQARVLAPDESVEVLGLRLTLSTKKLPKTPYVHMMLEIENLGHRPLAYRLQTRPSSGKTACARMRQVEHNSLALGAGETITRAECVYRKDRKLEISMVETKELPELGYFYLSSMDAGNFGLDLRTAKGHKGPDRLDRCRVQQESSLRTSILNGTIAWRDQVDFYARHRCQTYSFYGAYKEFNVDGQQSLPALLGDH